MERAMDQEVLFSWYTASAHASHLSVMICCRKRKFLVCALLLFAVFCVMKVLLNVSWRPRCQVRDFSAEMSRVRSACSQWPRENFYFVSRGVLKRNRRSSINTRCFLRQPYREVIMLSNREMPVRFHLLNLYCQYYSANSDLQQSQMILLPAIPRERMSVGGRQLVGAEEPWNVLMLGLGGVSKRVWQETMPKSFDIVKRDFHDAIVSKFVPLAADPRSSLEAVLRHNGQGSWITDMFARRHFVTQVGILTSATSSKPPLEVPATFNLSDYYRTRRQQHAAINGCVGLAPEGTIMMSWLREGHLLHTDREKVFSFLHLADPVFPSMARLDTELVAFLLDYLNQPSFAKSLLILFSLPDWRSGLEPGVLLISQPPQYRFTSQFRYNMIRSAATTDDFLTPNDLNRILTFLGSNDKPHHLRDINFETRTCPRLNVSGDVCKCINS